MSLNPSELSPFFWVDFSNASSITMNGSKISKINDLGSNGYHFTQANTSAQPALINNAVNGLSVARFTGIEALASTPTMLGTFTLLYAGLLSSTASHRNYLFNKNEYYATGYSGFPFALLAEANATSLSVVASTGNDYNVDSTISAGIEIGSPFFCCVEFSSSISRLYINTELKTTGNGVNINTNTRPWTIGRAAYEYSGGVGTSGLRGDIYEVILLPYILTPTQRNDINIYFMSKWLGIIQIGNNVTVSGNGPGENAAVIAAATKELVTLAPIDSAGNWTAGIPAGDYYVAYFADGCQPIIHGPYTVA